MNVSTEKGLFLLFNSDHGNWSTSISLESICKHNTYSKAKNIHPRPTVVKENPTLHGKTELWIDRGNTTKQALSFQLSMFKDTLGLPNVDLQYSMHRTQFSLWLAIESSWSYVVWIMWPCCCPCYAFESVSSSAIVEHKMGSSFSHGSWTSL